ncbi:MAG: dihydrolipoyl dehydrogenase [Clostridiales Family XIII bacterium]|nr:dihydrolipoyl dehydrogenase [Clostridiales Family XIII bacterium]
MVEAIIMPKLGFNMSEGKLVCWYKKEGDAIGKGEPFFSIETDKTTIDVEATRDGIVRSLLFRENETVPVMLPIAIVSDADENIEAELKAAKERLAGISSPGQTPSLSASGAPSVPARSDQPAPSGGARRREYDVIVIGGGPGGYVAAIRSAQLGKRVALVEKDKMGGVCLNRGCIPTKTFLRGVEALREVRDCERYGVSCADAHLAGIDMEKLQKRKNEIVAQLVGGVESLLKKNGVEKFDGTGAIVDANSVEVNGKTYTSEHIIIATGSLAKTLPVPTDDDMRPLTSDDLLSMTALPQDMLIVGGGVVGVELAYFLVSAGVKVRIVEFLDRILPMIDEEIAELASKKLKNLGVIVDTGARVTRIAEGAVFFESDGREHRAETRNVLMAVGREANLGGIDCEKLGIELDRGAIATDASLRTSVPNIFAIGDVNGKNMLAHTASMEGIVAAETIAGHACAMNYDRIPSVVYLRPELASVGLTEERAREKYASVKVGRFPLAANGKAKVAGESEGLAKIIIEEEYGEIVGAHLYCAHATDMIAEIVTAMNLEATADEIAMTVHPHPTISEVIQEAAHAIRGKAIHFA